MPPCLRIASCLIALFATPALRAQDVTSLITEAKAKIERNDYPAAVAALDRALTQDPENAEALRWRGHCRTVLGDHTKALADLDAAIALDPKSAWAWYARGMAKHNLGRPKHAIADYSKAIELDPTHHKAVEWRGFNRSLLGDHLGAYLDFTRAAELDARNPWVFHARGREAACLGDLTRAAEDFRAAIELDPKDAASHAQLGFVLVARGDDHTALKSFDRACELDENADAYVHLWRFWLERRLQRGDAQKLREALPASGWEGALAKVLCGECSREQLLARLETESLSASDLATRRCEAAFYLGVRALLEDRPGEAQPLFREALAYGDGRMPEWRAARRFAR